MDASPSVLAEAVRAKRAAIDQDLALLRVRLQDADPRRIDVGKWASRLLPVAGGTAALWLWTRRRRRAGSLEQLLVHGVRDLYLAECQIQAALDRMRPQASNEELAQALDRHRHETAGHIERLRRVCRSIGARPPRRGASAAVASIVADDTRVLRRHANRDVRDAWLIATAQRLEHLQIASYGTARAYAETLGYTFAAQLLQQTLEEHRAADGRLTLLAERFVNPRSVRSAPAR